MEIQEFARTVLFGTRIEDKLLVPGTFTDEDPVYRGELPETPGRDAKIALDLRRGGADFPSSSSLVHASSRAIAMHVFANHELMALELMALALLRFADAPKEFRRGIASTMLDEQRHFSLYRARAEELGVGFGDLSLSGFFWNSLKKMSTPLDYTTQIAMTFEQANLDFADHYAKHFHRLGDEKSATLMRAVYEDEIGHLAYGVHWFNSFRGSEENLWRAYQEALPPGLNPSRAKGLGFVVDGRKRGGLDEHFIEELRVFSASKGRPPRVYSCDVKSTDLPMWPPSHSFSAHELEQIGLELAPALISQCLSSDVLVAKAPSIPFLNRLEEVGIQIPEFVAPDKAIASLSRIRRLESIESFRWRERGGSLARALESEVPFRIEPESSSLIQYCENFAPSPEKPFSASASLRVSIVGDTRKRNLGLQTLQWVEGEEGCCWGLMMGRAFNGLPKEGLREELSSRAFLGARTLLYDRAQKEGGALRELGFLGRYSLVATVLASEGVAHCSVVSLELSPKLESVAVMLRRHLQTKRVGLWMFLPMEELRKEGFPDAAELVSYLEDTSPLEVITNQGRKMISSGALMTSPPESRQELVTFLLIAHRLGQFAETLPRLRRFFGNSASLKGS